MITTLNNVASRAIGSSLLDCRVRFSPSPEGVADSAGCLACCIRLSSATSKSASVCWSSRSADTSCKSDADWFLRSDHRFASWVASGGGLDSLLSEKTKFPIVANLPSRKTANSVSLRASFASNLGFSAVVGSFPTASRNSLSAANAFSVRSISADGVAVGDGVAFSVTSWVFDILCQYLS